MYNETWEEFELARDVFFDDTPDLGHMSVDEWELFHSFAANAEREELNAMWRRLNHYAGRYEGIALTAPSRACDLAVMT